MLKPNKSKIVANVLCVKKYMFPDVEILVKILKTEDVNGFVNVISTNTVLSVFPLFIKDEKNKIIFEEPVNIKNFICYYLLPGDTISGEIRCSGDERNKKYFINGIERLTK